MPDIQVIGVAPNRPAAERIVGNLRLRGLRQQAVSIIVVRPEEAEGLEHLDDQTGEGGKEVARSALKGALIGAVIGLLAGAGTLFIPDLRVVSPVILLALFGGSGAFVGTLSGAFAEEGVSDQIVNRYGMALREGQAIISVTVPTTETAKRAQELLKAAGAGNVHSFFKDEDETELEDELGVGVTEVTK